MYRRDPTLKMTFNTDTILLGFIHQSTLTLLLIVLHFGDFICSTLKWKWQLRSYIDCCFAHYSTTGCKHNTDLPPYHSYCG